MSAAPQPRHRRHGVAVRALLLVPALVLAGLLAGCGQETAPGEAVSALANRLDRVDAAVEARSFGRARDAVEALVAATTEARDAGEISGDQADRILAAAADLLARLPDEPAAEPTAPPSPAETAPPDEGREEGEGENEKEDKDEDEDEKKDDEEKKGKDEKKDDEEKKGKDEKD